jgi:hypothetical protein
MAEYVVEGAKLKCTHGTAGTLVTLRIQGDRRIRVIDKFRWIA